MDDTLSGAARTERAALALAVPLVAALDVRLLDETDPAAGVWFASSAPVAGNGVGGVHASVLGAVLELSAYLALLGQLRPDEHAVSHAVATQLLGAVRLGERVEARGVADARTGRLGFVTAVADGPGGPVARAQVTKSIVRFG